MERDDDGLCVHVHVCVGWKGLGAEGLHHKS